MTPYVSPEAPMKVRYNHTFAEYFERQNLPSDISDEVAARWHQAALKRLEEKNEEAMKNKV